MKTGMVSMPKLDGLVNSNCGLKDYIWKKVLKDVRDIIGARTQLLERLKQTWKKFLSFWAPELDDKNPSVDIATVFF